MIIFKKFTFDSAHFLPNVPDGHKCREIHGHTYQLTVFIDGPIHRDTGWVTDFAELKEAAGTVVDMVDHKLLNNIPGLENPTCEILCAWIWDQLKGRLPLLSKVELHETPTSGAIYDGSSQANGF